MKELSKTLLNKYFESRDLVSHNIKSFENLIEVRLQEIIDEIGDIEPDIIPYHLQSFRIRFGKIWVDKPRTKETDGSIRFITPMEARVRNLTYEAPVFVEMIKVENDKETEKENVHIGNIPIMVGSKYCYLHGKSREELIELGEDPDDPQGYFIINGTERVVMIIENLAPNKVFVEYKKNMTRPWRAKVFSSDGRYRMPHLLEKGKDGLITLTFSRVEKVPFVTLLKALGLDKDSEIVKEVTDEEEFSTDMYLNLYTSQPTSQEEALEKIGKKLGYYKSEERRIERAQQVIDKYLLPHVGHDPEDREYKAYFVARMVRKMLYTEAGRLEEGDKDHYGNKRLKLVGDSMETLIRYVIRRMVDDLKYNFERLVKRKKYPSLQGITRSKVLRSRLRSALATGEWIGDRHGVSQHLERLNHYASVSHLRRVISLLTSSKENFEARDLHPTHWGKLCTSETPEGQPIGLRKNLAITAEISTGEPFDEEKFLEEIKKAGMKKLGNEGIDVKLNGKLIGVHKKPKKLIKKVKKLRNKPAVCPELNYTYNKKENIVEFNTDAGRIRRPLLAVEGGELLLTKEHIKKLKKDKMKWQDLIDKGIIEYLDADEEENVLIAMNEDDITKDTTHMEISPSVIFGSQTAMIPYAEHTLSPRILYGAKMMKQGLGMFATNYPLQQNLADIAVMHYPQRPIVDTFMYDIANYDSHPVGQNLVVAVASGKGYNMEDAIVMNKATMERGAYRATYFTPYKTEELKYSGGQVDRIEIPDKDIKGYRSEEDYRFLEEDGIAYIDSDIKEGEVLVGKTSPPRFLSSLEEFRVNIESRMETSVELDRLGTATVTSAIITENEAGNKAVKVRVRDQTVPEIGDKFATRHGQKGIIGMILPEEDMPFTASGIKPDILFSPHSIPGRMTIGQLIEMLGGKVGALEGRQVDGSTFTGENEQDLRKALLKAGFREDGAETMYNGVTGEQFQVRIFVAPTYYLRLSHMVKNKFHVRSRGPVQLLTRQPTEGKSKGGGLRLGEMEKDCFVAHGSSLLLKERWDSDKAQIPVCSKCGITAIYNDYTGKGTCPVCGDDSPIKFVEISYAFKLFLDELKSMCIYPKINLGRK